jgi:hypothetical protein
MASKRQRRLGYVESLLQDALGNLATGNEERALRYLIIGIQVLRKHGEIEQTNSPKAEAEFAKLSQEALDAPAGWPSFAFDESKFSKYTELGLTSLLEKV